MSKMSKAGNIDSREFSIFFRTGQRVGAFPLYEVYTYLYIYMGPPSTFFPAVLVINEVRVLASRPDTLTQLLCLFICLIISRLLSCKSSLVFFLPNQVLKGPGNILRSSRQHLRPLVRLAVVHNSLCFLRNRKSYNLHMRFLIGKVRA